MINRSFRVLVALMAALIVSVTSVMGGSAQDMETAAQNIFYLAADENGVQQVFTQLVGGDDAGRQVTTAAANVMTYSIAGDGLGIAYISGGQVWLQSIHSEGAEAVATLAGEPTSTYRVAFSEDGNYVAYSDKGIWLLELATRETEMVLADVPLGGGAPSVDAFRSFKPVEFVRDEEGKETKLVVESMLFEGRTVGVVDLETGELVELEPFLHNQLLVADGGEVLLYGNGQIGPDEQRVRVASSLDDLNTHEVAAEFNQFPSEGLYAAAAAEISPNVVRVIGTGWVNIAEGQMATFVFDLDLATRTASGFKFVELPISEMSPDGNIGVVYHNFTYTENAEPSGAVELIDLATGEALDVELPETISAVKWHPY
jgi:hypothetical protein